MTRPVEEFKQLFEALLDDSCSDTLRRRYEDLLRANPELIAEHAAQMRLHAMLRWRTGSAAARPQRQNVARNVKWLRWSAAAIVLLGAGVFYYAMTRSTQSPVASLVESENVIWSVGAQTLVSGRRLAPGQIRIDSGRLKLIFDCGAVVMLEGSMSVEIIDGRNVRLDRGMLTARVENKVAGFAIMTPSARVLDLGTEFGVDVGATGQTDVVVFDGKIELSPKRSGTAPTNLGQGEAVRVDNQGGISRITSLRREFHEKKWSASLAGPAGAVIADVRDNRQAGANRKSYQIIPRGMEEGALAFVDRNHHWRAGAGSDFPKMIREADLVMTYNDDKHEPLQIDLTLACPARLFVLMDRRHPRPGWLHAEFKLVSSDLIIDEGAGVVHVYEIWEKSVPAGMFSLGANTGESMYGIAAIAER